MVGVSERHLSRLFVEHVGRTPGRLVREARLEAASQLLAGTREPLTTIAGRCGFASAEARSSGSRARVTESHPLVRRAWAAWPANSRRRDLAHLVAALPAPDQLSNPTGV